MTFIIRSEDLNGSAFRSREYTDESQNPTLSVTYQSTPNPTADVVADQQVSDGDDAGFATVFLDGTGSSDSDGSIVSYTWSESGTVIATGAAPSVDLSVGSHIITLTVEENDGLTGSDDVNITVYPYSGGQVITQLFTPEADTYVDLRYPDSNYGNFETRC